MPVRVTRYSYDANTWLRNAGELATRQYRLVTDKHLRTAVQSDTDSARL